MADGIVVGQSVAAEAVWHYVQEGQTKGPIPQSELTRMLSEGRLAADTPLWTEGMPDWAPAQQVAVFQTHLSSVPLVAPQQAVRPTLRQRAEAARAEGVPQVRPWVRFFARLCDSFSVGLVAGLTGLPAHAPEYAVILALPFLWIFIEAGLLSKWGTTPGKWLVGTWVTDRMGERLSYGGALSRGFSVWFMGLGFGLPVVSQVTQICGFVKLRRDGVTVWDRDSQCAVIHERIGPPRVAAVIAISAIVVALIVRAVAEAL